MYYILIREYKYHASLKNWTLIKNTEQYFNEHRWDTKLMVQPKAVTYGCAIWLQLKATWLIEPTMADISLCASYQAMNIPVFEDSYSEVIPGCYMYV